MRILFVTFSYYPETSGVPIVVQHIAEGLAARGNEVGVATRKNGLNLPDQDNINKVRVYRFEIGQNLFKKNIGDINGYISFVRNYQKDILVMECVQCQTTDLLLPYLKDMKCKVVLHSHGGPGVSMKPFGWEGDIIHTIGHTHNWYRWKKYYSQTLPLYSKYIDSTICLSLCASDLNYMNRTMSNVLIIGNAANEIFYDESAYEKDVAEILGLNNKEYILCIANYFPNKSQLDIVHAFEQVTNPKCCLVMIGSKKTPYYEKVLSASKKVHEETKKEIRVLTGIDRNMFPAIISHAKLFVMASRHEEYPVSLVEAMACGTPFVSTDAGCSRLLPGGVTVVDRKDLGLYMDIIEKDGKYRDSLGACGRKYAIDNNTSDAIIDKFVSAISTNSEK